VGRSAAGAAVAVEEEEPLEQAANRSAIRPSFDRCSSRSPSLETYRVETLTHVKIPPQNVNEDPSISHAIWPILEPVQKEMYLNLAFAR
jgi:hypothetical protein